MVYEMNLWHDSFEKIKEKTKTIEMRLNDEKRSHIKDKGESFYGPEGNRLHFRWFNISEVKNLQIKPNFLMEKLNPLPDILDHLIHRDV